MPDEQHSTRIPPEETDEWYRRPWRERVQAADVAIAGLVLVIALVGGLAFFLTGSSTVRGYRHLAVNEPSAGSVRAPKASDRSPSPTALSSSSAGGASTRGATTQTTVTTGQTTGGTTPAAAPGHSATSDPSTADPASTTTVPSGATKPVAASQAPACTPGDLTISTVTEAAQYSLGSPVTITTTLVADVSCVYDQLPAGSYSCPTTVVVVNQVGGQVYPYPGQSEQCAGVRSGTLARGAALTVTVVWEDPPLGQYSAVGTWSWGEPGAPYQESATSPPFDIVP